MNILLPDWLFLSLYCIYLFLCICLRLPVCHGACLEVRGQLVRVGSLLPSSESQGWNISGLVVMPLPSCWPLFFFFFLQLLFPPTIYFKNSGVASREMVYSAQRSVFKHKEPGKSQEWGCARHHRGTVLRQ